MEFPQIGAQCSNPHCKQLDFLPLTCSECQLTFCKDHHSQDNHDCVQNPALVVKDKQAVKSYICSTENCSSKSAIEMACSICQKHFCLEHRHHGCGDPKIARRIEEREKIQANKLQFRAAKEEADRQVEESLNRAKQKSGTSKMATQLEFMRLKTKAVGPTKIPMESRVYFSVYPPLFMKQKCKAVFVDKNWTVGRFLDSLAHRSSCNIPNNNKTNVGKLVLFHHSTGKPVSMNSIRRLDDLLREKELVDGESLILEFIEGEGVNKFNLDNFQLSNLSLYKT